MKAFFAVALLLVSAVAMAGDKNTLGIPDDGTQYGGGNATVTNRTLTCQGSASSAQGCYELAVECLDAAEGSDLVSIDCAIVDE